MEHRCVYHFSYQDMTPFTAAFSYSDIQSLLTRMHERLSDFFFFKSYTNMHLPKCADAEMHTCMNSNTLRILLFFRTEFLAYEGEK